VKTVKNTQENNGVGRLVDQIYAMKDKSYWKMVNAKIARLIRELVRIKSSAFQISVTSGKS